MVNAYLLDMAFPIPPLKLPLHGARDDPLMGYTIWLAFYRSMLISEPHLFTGEISFTFTSKLPVRNCLSKTKFKTIIINPIVKIGLIQPAATGLNKRR